MSIYSIQKDSIMFSHLGIKEDQLESFISNIAKKTLEGHQAVTPKQIFRLHEMMFVNSPNEISLRFKERVLDEKDTAHLVFRLYMSLKSITDGQTKTSVIHTGSNGARLIKAIIGEKEVPTFVQKSTRLSEDDFGVPVKKGAVREKMAYLLDRGFGHVPPTVLLDLEEFGLGLSSFQKFIEGAKDLESCDKLTKESFHQLKRKLMIQNLVILNLDFCERNMLVKDKMLFSIDHGYSLPTKLTEKPLDCARDFKFNNDPFTEEEKDYILSLPEEKLSALLERHGIDADAIRIQRIMVQILKTAVNRTDVTLDHVVKLFYFGPVRYAGGWASNSVRNAALYRKEMLAIVNAKSDDEVKQAIKEALDNMLKLS